MVFPLAIPLLSAGLGGLATGWAQSALINSKKDKQVATGGDTIHHPYSNYQPSNELQYTYNPIITYPDYQTMIDSPLGHQSTKKAPAQPVSHRAIREFPTLCGGLPTPFRH